jgi:hypothetical protein
MDSSPPEQTAQLRTEEQIAGSRAVGVSEVEFFDYPDGMLEWAEQGGPDIPYPTGPREACQVTVGEELVTVGYIESPAGLVFRICQNHPCGSVRLLVPPRITLRGGDAITRRSPY